MNPLLLQYFNAVVKSGSITGAAKLLRVSQPSVSKMIKNLEDELKVKLVNRSKHGITLTDVGEKIAIKCESIFSDISDIQNITKQHQVTCSGVLSIGASDNVCTYILPKIIKEYLSVYPLVDFKIYAGTSNDIQKQLLNNTVELGIFYTPVEKPNIYDMWKIAHIRFVVVCSPELNITKLDTLISRSLYIGSLREDYTKLSPALSMFYEQLGVSPNNVMQTNNQEMQKQLALQGIGYTIVPEHIVSKELQSGELVEIKTNKKLISPLFLVKRSSRNLNKPAIEFKKILSDFSRP